MNKKEMNDVEWQRFLFLEQFLEIEYEGKNSSGLLLFITRRNTGK